MAIDERTRANPRYRELVEHYRFARHAWATNEALRRAAETLGMSERRYCDYFVADHFTPVTILTSSTGFSCNEYWNTGAWDTAFAEAAPVTEEGG
jgi:predicted NAD/FAD-binding protein